MERHVIEKMARTTYRLSIPENAPRNLLSVIRRRLSRKVAVLCRAGIVEGEFLPAVLEVDLMFLVLLGQGRDRLVVRVRSGAWRPCLPNGMERSAPFVPCGCVLDDEVPLQVNVRRPAQRAVAFELAGTGDLPATNRACAINSEMVPI